MDVDIAADRKRKIANVLETYYSDASLRWDKVMQSKINKDPEGFVPLSTLTTLSRFKSLQATEEEIKEAATTYSLSKLQASFFQYYFSRLDERGVARIKPFVLTKKEELDDWSIYVEGLEKPYQTEKAISELFTRLVGHVSYIRIPVDRSGKARFFGYCFVEFDDKSNVQKAVKMLNRYGTVNAGEGTDEIKQEADALNLRVMTKLEWNTYKEQYLALQNARKQDIQRLWAEYQETKDVEPPAAQETLGSLPESQADHITYPKGVIVLVINVHPKSSKTVIKCHVRLSTPEDAQTVVSYFQRNKLFQRDANDVDGQPLQTGEPQQFVSVRLLEGQEEQIYWENDKANQT
ncbi:hypothetical protein EC973_000900 [Apophysomyces ossiformis]|uniref:Uncharacterized protein n=1 Tax=Apophysomyces ossiformis TaxID=679940 RepID=A0A8H7BR19_9FUNG|nr:hypothetical protein EC973_000900 [Apophysomyces ossiformis]